MGHKAYPSPWINMRHLDSNQKPGCREVHWIAQYLRQAREARGWSLADFERHHPGFHQVTLGSYERGARRPDPVQLDAILGCYGLRLAVVPAGWEGAPDLPRRDGLLDVVRRLRLLAAELEDLPGKAGRATEVRLGSNEDAAGPGGDT